MSEWIGTLAVGEPCRMIFKSMWGTSAFESSAPEIAHLTHLNQPPLSRERVPSVLNSNKLIQILLEILGAQGVSIEFATISGTRRDRGFGDVCLREGCEIANAHFWLGTPRTLKRNVL